MKNEFSNLRSIPNYRSNAGEATTSAKSGVRNGEAVIIVPEDDIDDKIIIERYRSAIGIGGNIESFALHQRNVSAEKNKQLFQLDQIKTYGSASGSPQKIISRSKDILQRLLTNQKLPVPDSSVSSIMQQYMSLQLLARAIEGSEERFVSLLTPQKEIAEDLGSLAKKLQQAGDDSEEIASLLSEISGLPNDRNQLQNLMATLRFQPEKLKNKLKEWQNLPDFENLSKKELSEKISDALREIEARNGGTIRAAINSFGPGLETGDIERFQQGYNDVVNETTGFSDLLAKLLNHYNFGELKSVLPRLKQALAEDLRSDQRSTDKVKLESILNDLSFMHISATLIDLVSTLTSGMSRIFNIESSENSGFNEKKLMQAIGKLVSGGWISPSQFERTISDLKIPDGAPAIYFLNGIKEIIRQLPFKVTTDIESRNALIEAAQTAIDSVVEREELMILEGKSDGLG